MAVVAERSIEIRHWRRSVGVSLFSLKKKILAKKKTKSKSARDTEEFLICSLHRRGFAVGSSCWNCSISFQFLLFTHTKKNNKKKSQRKKRRCGGSSSLSSVADGVERISNIFVLFLKKKSAQIGWHRSHFSVTFFLEGGWNEFGTFPFSLTVWIEWKTR